MKKRTYGRQLTLTVFIFAFLLGSCSTISKHEPVYSYALPNETVAASQVEEYRLAREPAASDPKKTCAHWLALATRPNFPLATLAKLRAIEVCPVGPGYESLALDQVATTSTESWLREDFARALLARSIKAGDKKWEAKFAFEVAQFEPVQLNQIELLERSIALSMKANDLQAAADARRFLYLIAPRKIPAPTPDQYLAVAMDYRRARDFGKAREYFDRVISMKEFSDADKLKALDGVRISHKLQKNTERYLRSTRDFANFARWRYFEKSSGRPSDYNIYLNSQITLARALWTDGNPARAEKILIDAEKDVGGKIFVGEATFIRARIAEERGQYNEAVGILDGIDRERLKRDRPLRARLGWYRAWNLRKIGRLPDAVQTFEQLVSDEEPTSTNLARDQYWLARTYRDLGDGAKANAIFESLLISDPIGYYGAISYRELKRPMPAIEGAKGTAKRSIDPLLPQERLQYEWLLAVHEEEVATRLLNAIGQERRAGYTQEESFELLRAYARTGKYNSLFARLTDLSSPARLALLETEPKLIFPVRWSQLVTTAGAKNDIKPEFVYSIIRQESAFDPHARSHADAFGLMQLIPEMANQATSTAGIQLTVNEDLYKPEVNIGLGTAFLRSQLNRWKNAFIPTVASYNASEKAVIGWLRTRDRRDPVAFIEDVPYDETRTYLKLVMRNYVFYSRLISEQREIPFPEWCLGDLQGIKL